VEIEKAEKPAKTSRARMSIRSSDFMGKFSFVFSWFDPIVTKVTLKGGGEYTGRLAFFNEQFCSWSKFPKPVTKVAFEGPGNNSPVIQL
jgi:hypothetical protein